MLNQEKKGGLVLFFYLPKTKGKENNEWVRP